MPYTLDAVDALQNRRRPSAGVGRAALVTFLLNAYHVRIPNHFLQQRLCFSVNYSLNPLIRFRYLCRQTRDKTQRIRGVSFFSN